MAELRIACATDAAYAPYCAAMLQGLLRQHPQDLTVHLLPGADLPQAQREALRTLVERGGGRFQPIDVDARAVADLPRMPRIPPVMWLRVLLPELLPQADRLLYLDIDTLALGPLEELWNTDLEGKLVAAVDNVLHADLASRPAALGLPADARYFNSGVLLMDLRGMRRAGIPGRIVDCARTHAAQLLWPDQDALNIVLAGRRKTLHPRWNCQNSFFYWRERSIEVLGQAAVDEAVNAPALLHFEGPSWAKPWHFFSDHPYRPAWRAVQRTTGWELPPPDGRLRKFVSHLPAALIGAMRGALGYPRPRRPRAGPWLRRPASTRRACP